MTTPAEPILVTGSSGFIGSWLVQALREAGVARLLLDRAPWVGRSPERSICADIQNLGELKTIAAEYGRPPVAAHLAALGEVVLPFAQIEELYRTNALGAWNVLAAFNPNRFVFTSSSAVYGSSSRPVSESWDEVNPVGNYGASKVAGELICRDWAAEGPNRAAVCLRLANIIGPGCRGLLRYLANHVARYPDGAVPARLRGGGKLIRDYVPIRVAVQAIAASCRKDWDPGFHAVNVSTGFGLTNGDIVNAAREEIERAGFQLRVAWSEESGRGEARSIVLDPEKMVERLGVAPPSKDEVFEEVRRSIRCALEREGAACAL
jgi:nucleoside-diphosphate-sugar epimerase